MNKNIKIVSSLALAGILSINTWGAKVLATNPVQEYKKSEGVYRNVLQEKLAVPFLLAEGEQVTINDLAKEFDLVSFNNQSVDLPLDGNKLVKTGDKFADENNEFTVIVYGDVNKDGIVDVADAVKINEYAVSLIELDDEQKAAANIKNDGEIDVADAVKINEFVVGITASVKDIEEGELPPDTQAPVVTNIPENGVTNQAVTPEFADNIAIRSITLNGEKYVKGTPITQTGAYTMVVSDYAGNTTTINFTINAKLPVIEGIDQDTIIVEKGAETVKLPEATAEGATIEVIGKEDIKLDTLGAYEVTYKATDALGNVATKVVTVIVDDGTLPELKVNYNDALVTNKPVKVTMTSNKPVQLPEGWSYVVDKDGNEVKTAIEKTFSQNEDGVVTVYDLVGNKVEKPYSIANIDITVDVKVTYSYNGNSNVEELNPTRDDVTVTITAVDNEEITGLNEKEGWTEVTPKKEYTKVYTDNIEETVLLKDALGNERNLTITIDNIDRVGAGAEVTYDYTEKTKNDVTVTITADEELDMTPTGIPAGWTQVPDSKTQITKTYTQNSKEQVIITDLVGNTSTVVVNVNNIDRDKPAGVVEYSTKEKTNQDVVVTVTATEEIQPVEGWELKEDKKTLTKTFSENITTKITIVDIAGNESIAIPINITNIDRTPAKKVNQRVSSSGEAKSKTIYITFDEAMQEIEGWTLDTADGNKTYYKTYSESGEYTVEFKDLAGNVTEVTFTISGVDSEEPDVDVMYQNVDSTTGEAIENQGVTNQNVKVTITLLNENKTIQEMNGWTLSEDKKSMTKIYSSNTDEWVEVQDTLGNKTRVRVTVDNIDTVGPNLEIVNQDYNNGPMSNQNIEVIVTADKKVTVDPTLEGWIVEYDEATGKTTLTKIFEENATENLIVVDEAGNEGTTTIEITQIDKQAPVLKVGTEEVVTGNVYKDDQTVKVEDADLEEAILYVDGEKQDIADLTTTIKTGYTTQTEAEKSVEYTFILKDVYGNTSSVKYTIDKIAPTITGVEDAGQYATVTPKSEDTDIEEVVLTKDGEVVEGYTLGTAITEKGTYTLTVTDKAGNVTTVQNFIVDTDLPNITGVENSAIYNTEVTPTTTETDIEAEGVVLTRDGEEVEGYTLGTAITEEGEYALTVTDIVGNTITINFTIDTTAPEITGVESQDELKVATPKSEDTDIEEVELTKTVDGETSIVKGYTLGTAITEEGIYTLTVTDKAGNVTTIEDFIIDTTAPEITVTAGTPVEVDGEERYQSITIGASDENTYTVMLTRDDIPQAGYPQTVASVTLNETGKWVVTVTDKAGNSVSETFIVDATGPVGRVNYETEEPTKDPIRVTITFDESIKEITNADSFDWKISADKKTIYADVNDSNAHEITVTDVFGNVGTVKFQAKNYDVTINAPTMTKEVLTSGSVKVIMTFDEEVQLPTGWNYDETDETNCTIYKVFDSTVTEFTVIVLDKAGNACNVEQEISAIN